MVRSSHSNSPATADIGGACGGPKPAVIGGLPLPANQAVGVAARCSVERITLRAVTAITNSDEHQDQRRAPLYSPYAANSTRPVFPPLEVSTSN